MVAGLVFWGTASLIPRWGRKADGGPILYPTHALFYTIQFERSTLQGIESIFADHLVQNGATPKAKPRELAKYFYKLCLRYQLDPAFVLSVVEVESDFQTAIVSHAGAVGLMQLMPATARVLARRYGLLYPGRESLKDPYINLALGMAYLRELKDRYVGLSPYYHLAAYNMGPARLDELRARPGFRPDQTLRYYQDVMKGVDRWRYYKMSRVPRDLPISRLRRSARVAKDGPPPKKRLQNAAPKPAFRIKEAA